METEIGHKPVVLSDPQRRQVTTALDDPMHSMRALCKGSLFMFMRYMWDTYSQDTFVPNWHIEYLCEELEVIARRVAAGEDKEYDLIINVPPGTSKTATVSIFFPIWCWVNWYWMRFITSSHSATLSLESAEYSRDIIRSEKFQALFPELDIKQNKDSKSNFRVVYKEHVSPGRLPRLKQGGGRISTSVDARIIGFHAHLIIPDDIIDPKRALSEIGLATANDHLDTLATRKTDKKVTTTIMIMQRLHQIDPTGYLLEKGKGNIRHICLPGEIRHYGEFLRPVELRDRYIDDLLDVKRLPWNVLEEMLSDLGQYGFAGQVGQNPAPPGGGMFKIDHINTIDKLDNPEWILQTMRYWDKAGTQDGGAYTAGVKMSKLKNGTFLIHDVKRGQWATEKREKIIKSTAIADGHNVRVVIEQEPGSGGKESAQATIRNLAGFSVYADRPTGDKVFRADPFSVQVNNGNISILRADWNKAFKDELEIFPNGTYKDQVDAASGAFNLLAGKKQARVIR